MTRRRLRSLFYSAFTEDDRLNRIDGFLWLTISLLAATAHAGGPAALFVDTGPIAISLEGPLAQIAHDDDADPAYRTATLIWKDASGVDVRIPVAVKPRGKSRRRDGACQFPPLRLNFSKSSAAGTPFAELDKVKLVTHCGRLGDSNIAYANRVRLELLLYRVFNRVSPTSLRVRPLDLTYIDTDRDDKRSGVQAGFLIEPEEMLARRVGAEAADVDAIDRDQLEPAQTSLVEVFEYLAGNTDFSMIRGPAGDHCCHNVVLLTTATGVLLPVPYDFDATGVVGAPYAKPAEGLGITNVHQRLYRGYCRPESELDATLAVFREAKADIYGLFRGDDRLDRRTIDKTVEYLDEFYAIIDRPYELKRKVSSRCI